MPNFANPMPSTPAPASPQMSSMSSPGGFDSILQFLGNLLTNKQSMQGTQWGQALALQQQRQQQAAQAQQFGEQQQVNQTSMPYLSMINDFQQQLVRAQQPSPYKPVLTSPNTGATPVGSTPPSPYYIQPQVRQG